MISPEQPPSDFYPMHPVSAADCDDGLRKQRLRETRMGYTWGPVRRTLAKVACGSLISMGTIGSAYYQYDVGPEQARLAQETVMISDSREAAWPDGATTGVYVIPGLGNVDGKDAADNLGAYDQIGNVKAVRLDNQGIDEDVISQQILKNAEEHGLEYVFIDGESMGGEVAAGVARRIYEDKETNVKLLGVTFDCTPTGEGNVRPDKQRLGRLMVKLLDTIPGARYSRALRYMTEMGVREDQYIEDGIQMHGPIPLPFGVNIGRLHETSDQVLRDKIFNPSVASNQLIGKQYDFIERTQMLVDLEALSKPHDGKPVPSIFYMRPVDGQKDTTVNVDGAEQTIIATVNFQKGQFEVVAMHGTEHANPGQAPGPYNEAIVQKLIGTIRQVRDADRRPPTLPEGTSVILAQGENPLHTPGR